MLTWSTIVSVVLGLVKGIVSLFNKSVEYFREKMLIQTGKELEQGEMAKREIDINRRQTEILTQTITKDQTEKKLRDGNF